MVREAREREEDERKRVDEEREEEEEGQGREPRVRTQKKRPHSNTTRPSSQFAIATFCTRACINVYVHGKFISGQQPLGLGPAVFHNGYLPTASTWEGGKGRQLGNDNRFNPLKTTPTSPSSPRPFLRLPS